ncbi:proteasome subunit domain-containing protein [Ditylenchus destructor]|nr:proteasome subunit domain-containing protein [Ditylenchus destructor]
MSSIGTGYDLAASTFSPDGRIFQVEYAQKAVDSCGTLVAIAGKNGVVTAVDKTINSKLIVESGNPRVAHVNEYIGFSSAGVYSDGRALLDYVQDDAIKYLKEYRTPIHTKKLAQSLAEWVHYFTLGFSRPFGATVFLTAYEEETPSIHVIEPSGLCYAYKAWAVGKHRQAAKTEIEKLKLDELDMDQLLKEAVRILLTIRDESNQKNLKIEAGWVGESTNGKFQIVKKEEVEAAEQWAKSQLEEEDDE